MQNCFSALVESLGQQDAQTISEAKGLVHELHRITLLWDELWVGTLSTHHTEVNRWDFSFKTTWQELDKLFFTACQIYIYVVRSK